MNLQKPEAQPAGNLSSVDGDEYVFLNCPYDRRFEPLYLAYIAGIAAFGLQPTTALEIGGGERRLDRIIELIQSCKYSFHDLSRVEMDLHRPATPRLNMGFELGLTVMWAKLHTGKHTWFVFEAKRRRIQKSLSDLAGTDEYVHQGSVKGVLREIGNALVRPNGPSMNQMLAIYQGLGTSLPEILKVTGARSPFEARVFTELVASAMVRAKMLLPREGGPKV